MVDQRSEDVGEDLEDADEEEAHKHPLADLLRQRRLHDPAENKADTSDGDRDHDSRPDHEAFAEGANVYHMPFDDCGEGGISRLRPSPAEVPWRALER